MTSLSTLESPVVCATGKRRAVRSPSTSPPGRPAQKPPHSSPEALTVLMAEDDSIRRWMIREFLVEAGYTILEAAAGPEVLDLVETWPGPLHVVLASSSLPGLAGLELLERVHAVRPETAVVMMSSLSLRTVLGERPAGFLQRPFSRGDLLSAVASSLREQPR